MLGGPHGKQQILPQQHTLPLIPLVPRSPKNHLLKPVHPARSCGNLLYLHVLKAGLAGGGSSPPALSVPTAALLTPTAATRGPCFAPSELVSAHASLMPTCAAARPSHQQFWLHVVALRLQPCRGW
jgi:hypothetical protein